MDNSHPPALHYQRGTAQTATVSVSYLGVSFITMQEYISFFFLYIFLTLIYASGLFVGVLYEHKISDSNQLKRMKVIIFFLYDTCPKTHLTP